MRALAQIRASGVVKQWMRRRFRLSVSVASSSSTHLKLASMTSHVASSMPGGALTSASTQVMGLMQACLYCASLAGLRYAIEVVDDDVGAKKGDHGGKVGARVPASLGQGRPAQSGDNPVSQGLLNGNVFGKHIL